MPESQVAFAGANSERAQTSRSGRLFPLLALSGLLLALTVIYWQFVPTDSGSSDTGIYFSGAESLAEGKGYKFLAYANHPPISLYPPGQSAYLSLFWRMDPQFPQNIPILYGGMILLALGVVALLGAYWWREGMSWRATGLLLVAWSLSPLWCWQLGTFLSDILFVFLWLAVAWCWQRAENWDSTPRWFATGLLVALMYLTRSAALAPLVALMAVAGWRVLHGQWRPALAYLVPSVATVLFWKMLATGNVTYLDTFRSRLIDEGGWGGMMGYFGKQFIDYASGAHFFRGLFPWLMQLPGMPGLPDWGLNALTLVLMVCGWAFMALWIWGWWRSRTKVDRLLGAMVLAFLVEHVLWPFGIGERIVFSVLPFILLWAWRGTVALIELRPAVRWPRWAVAGFVVVSAVGNITLLPQKLVEWNQHNKLSELAEVGSWTRNNTPTNAVIAISWGLPVLHFHHASGRSVMQDTMEPLSEQVVLPASQGEIEPGYLLCSGHKPLTDSVARKHHLQSVKQSQNGFYHLYRFAKGNNESGSSASSVAAR